MHEDNEYAQYGNYFLVAESLLVVAYAAILASDQSTYRRHALLAAGVIAVFGLLVTLVWAYVCHHQWRDVKSLRDHAVELLPEYRTTIARRRNPIVPPKALMTYVVPRVGRHHVGDSCGADYPGGLPAEPVSGWTTVGRERVTHTSRKREVHRRSRLARWCSPT